MTTNMNSDFDHMTDLFRQGEFDQALPILSRMITDQPSNWNLHYLTGLAHRFKGDLETARQSYERALELNPEEPSLLLAAGVCEQQAGNLKPAVAFLRKAVKLAPGSPEAHNSLGLTLRMMGKPSGAIRSYLTGIKALIDSVIAQIAQSQEREKYFREVTTEDGQKALQMNPAIWELVTHINKQNLMFATFQNNLGVCHAELDNLEKARECFQTSIEYTPDGMEYPLPVDGLKELDRT
jgi:tetratricopeptide (TPR) repeat protein